jgi:hypothetical protein
MCLLSYYPPGAAPDPNALANGAWINRDGHGFAIVTDKRIIVRHGMDPEVLIATFTRMRSKHPDGPALFHSRFGTHGSIGRHNCHPFRVGGDRRTVLAHNGILPELVQPAKGDRRCDTRVAAEDFLPHEPFGPLDDPDSRERLGAWMGASNKLVILTVNPRYRQRTYLINAEHGLWDGGVWYSNSDYLDPTTAHRWAEDIDDLCPGCGAIGASRLAGGYCPECATCFDCARPYHECLCWRPDHADQWADEHDREVEEIPGGLLPYLLGERPTR